jgi:nucleoside-diphosphate-sugar epimerase
VNLQVKAALAGCDVVIHTASPVHGRSKDFYYAVNVTGTKNILEVGRFFYIVAQGSVYLLRLILLYR